MISSLIRFLDSSLQQHTRIRAFTTGARIVLAAMVLVLVLVFPARTHGQQVVQGTRGVADFRATIMLRGMAALEQKRGLTNNANRPAKLSPRPMPHVPATNQPPGGGGAAAPDFSAAAVGPIVTSPPPAISFQAVPDNNFSIPPDTHGAVGPNHVMTVLNTQVRIQDRKGVELSTVSLDTFWLPIGAGSAFDPKVLYDKTADRWIFTAMGDAQSPFSAVLVAVSQSSDPTGNWFLYRIDADQANVLWADYPSIGFNKDWIVVTANMFPIFFGPTEINIYAFNKTNLYAGGVGQYTLLQETNGTSLTIVPAITHDDTLSTMYLVEIENFGITFFTGISSRLRVSTITGSPGAEQLTLGTAFVDPASPWFSRDPNFGFGLPQFGSTIGIAGNDSRIQNVVYRNGSLWCTHHVFLPAFNPTHAAVQWFQFTPGGFIQQFGRIEDPSGVISYAYPTIAVNRNDDALIGFSRFSTNQFASANYAFRAFDDPPNKMQADYVLKAGEAPYVKTFGGFENRWGDYSSTVMDPLNDVDMWTIQEYAAQPAGGFSRWGTWWGQVCGARGPRFELNDYTVSEAPPPGSATISVLNVGGGAGTVDYATANGTALAGIDYTPVSGTLNFAAGQSVASFTIPVFNNPDVNSNKTVLLTLRNATGADGIGCISNAVLTIIDDESLPIVSTAGEFNFSSYLQFGIPYEVTENETDFDLFCYPVSPPDRERSALGALITVVRTNGSTGRVLVDYTTVDFAGTAVPYFDYIPTNGTMVFDDFQMSTNFVIPVFMDFFLQTNGHKFLNIALSNPRPAPEEEATHPGLIRPTLGPGSISGLFIYEINWGFCLQNFTFNPTNFAITTNFTCLNAFTWERLNYRTDEYPGRVPGTGGTKNVTLTVLLTDGGPGSVNVVFPNHVSGFILTAGSDYAASPGGGAEVLPNPVFRDTSLNIITNVLDYQARDFVLTFGANDCRLNVTLVITNDSDVEFNEDAIVLLFPIPGNPPVNPFGQICNVTILADDQPAGALDREWNPDNLEFTSPPFNQTPGANNVVNTVAVQPDNKTVLGGDFTAVNAQPRNRLARLNVNGSLDTTFNPGTAADGSVNAVLLYPPNSANAGRILIGGGFSSYNGQQRNGVARVLPSGALDTTFHPGNGANGAVRALALQADGKILVAGDFTEFNDFGRNGIARLNPDGTLDLSFDVGTGADAAIWSIGLLSDGAGGESVLISGDFLFFGDQFRAGVARLTSTGGLDLNFDPGGGANGSVYALAVQTNGTIVIAGAFTEFDARRRIGIARLNSDGTIDATFDPGNGPDNSIYALTLQPDQKAVIGGPFTSFNGTRRMGYARLRLDGSLDTSFMDTAYNQFAGLIKALSFEPPNYVNSIALQPDGHIMLGGSFTNIGGNPSYQQDVRNYYTVFTRADKRPRYNIARVLGGTTPGTGNAEFDTDTYYVDENGGFASLKLQRVDGRLGTLVAEAGTMDRTANNGVDFLATNLVSVWPQGFYQTNIDFTFPIQFPTNFSPLSVGRVDPNYLRVPILDDRLQEGDELVDLSFLRPSGEIMLGGELIPLGGALGRASARLSILDNDFNPGVFAFSSPTYVTNENAVRAIITVIRTNGSVGQVSVDYFTTTEVTPPVATTNADYATTRGTLTFASGQTSRTFLVSIVNDTEVEFDENIGLVLTNATGGAKLPGGTPTSITTARLTIVDNDFPPGRLNFGLTSFTANEADGFATVTVTRTGGNLGAISTDFRTVDGSATTPSDYAATNGTLFWNDGESVPKSFLIPLRTDGLAEGAETLAVQLLNARVGGVLNTNLLGLRTNVPVVIEDADSYGIVAFNQPYYQADESGGQAIITVVRSAGIAGTGTVNYATIPPGLPNSGTAIPGIDYLDTSGTLTFLPGEISKTIVVTLLDDTDSDGNKVVNLLLSNPVNVTLGVPSQVALTIIDNRSFNEPAGSLDTGFTPEAQADGPVLALALQTTNGITDGRIVVAGDFTDFNQVSRKRLARLMSNGTLDPSFDPGPGANDAIRAITMQPDGKLLIGGFFTEVLGTNRNRIARLNSDGSFDAFFNPGAGADNPIYALTLQPDGRILVGGAFSSFNSISRPGIVRLNTNGTLDTMFNAGAGADGPVFAVALQADGRVLIGGEFSSVGGVPRNRIARLNANGSLDTTFDPGAGMDGPVRALLFQPDGKIVAGGSFATVGGTPRSYLARLNQDGSLDTSFLASPLTGADGSVFTLVLQVDGRIVVGGDFSRFNGVSRSRITRLHTDGSSDPTINFGSGTDAFVSALLIQPDRKIVLGGGFTKYDGERRLRIARIHGGAIIGPGSLEFSAPEFLAGENSTNALITVRRRGGTTGVAGVNYQTVNGTAVAGVDYQAASGTLTFPEAETRQTFVVSILNNSTPDGDRTLSLELINGSYTGGAVAGPQPVSTLRILDDEGVVGFTTANFSVNESVASLLATITVRRSGATNGPVSVNFATIAGGTATAGVDYRTTNGTLSFLPGELTKSFHVRILDDLLNESGETVLLQLSNASNSNALGIASATLLIVDNEFSQGQFVFSAPSYAVSEDATNAFLTVLRTNGSSGLVTVSYRTLDGSAIGGVDYVGTNHILAFADGETAKTIQVPLIDDLLVEAPETFIVTLFNPTGGASLGAPNQAVISMVDNDVSFIIPAGSTLLSESLTNNGIIDPGETVTIAFALRNVGSGDTPSLLGTLLPGNGLTAPSAPQTYGVLLANGPAVAQPYTFTASGAVGDRLVAVLQLTDGVTTNGFVSFGFTIGGQASRNFANTNRITINDDAPALPYPSIINVANMGGTVTKVSVTISNLTHGFPDDVDLLLISPAGQRVMLMSDAGSTSAQPHPVNNVTLKFDAAAAGLLSDSNQITSGTYQPVNYAGPGLNTSDTFPPPAPQPIPLVDPFPYTNTAMSVFNGVSPNGAWSLFVMDDTPGQNGSIGGWSLEIQTSDPVAPSAGVSIADLAVLASGVPASAVIGANYTCTFTITNRGPAPAESVALLDQMPAGLTLVSASTSAGTWSKVQGTLTWNIGSLASGATASMTLVSRPTVLGTLSSTATVSANQIDPSLGNNSINMVTTVLGLPALTVTRVGGSLRLSWPASSGFKLQANDTLNPANWTDVGNTPLVDNGQNVLTVGVPGSARFYRLRSP
jgi:uncharacterized delta-60 repeat protein/uncharacterized repeat protein (TIGR01451 family)